jgi:hypothetical protein
VGCQLGRFGPTVRSAGLLVGRTHLSGTAVSLVGGDPWVPMSHRFPGKLFIRTASHFPCSMGLDFSSVCKESNLRVNGSFHGCVDSPLSSLDFRVFFELFSSVFRAQLVPSTLRCLGSDLLVGIMDSCLVHLCA